MSVSFMHLKAKDGLRNNARLSHEFLGRLRYRWENTFRKSGLPTGSPLRVTEINHDMAKGFVVFEVLDCTPYAKIKLAPNELAHFFDRHG